MSKKDKIKRNPLFTRASVSLGGRKRRAPTGVTFDSDTEDEAAPAKRINPETPMKAGGHEYSMHSRVSRVADTKKPADTEQDAPTDDVEMDDPAFQNAQGAPNTIGKSGSLNTSRSNYWHDRKKGKRFFKKQMISYVEIDDTGTNATAHGLPTILLDRDGTTSHMLKGTINLRCRTIPYYRTAASMTIGEYTALIRENAAFRCTKVGFHLDGIQPMSDELSQIGGNVIQNNTFTERPYMEYMVDNYRMLPPRRTHGQSHNEQFAVYNCFQRGDAEGGGSLPKYPTIPTKVPRAQACNVFNDKSFQYFANDGKEYPLDPLLNLRTKNTIEELTSESTVNHSYRFKHPAWRISAPFYNHEGSIIHPGNTRNLPGDETRYWNEYVWTGRQSDHTEAVDQGEWFYYHPEMQPLATYTTGAQIDKRHYDVPPDVFIWPAAIPKSDGSKMRIFFKVKLTYWSEWETVPRSERSWQPSYFEAADLNAVEDDTVESNLSAGNNMIFATAENLVNAMPHNPASMMRGQSAVCDQHDHFRLQMKESYDFS